jgi:N-glycosylase/DNA lyase
VSSSSAINSSATPSAANQAWKHGFLFPVREYDLDATLTSGQSFGWEHFSEGWAGVIQGRWVRLRQEADSIHAQTVEPQADWNWLAKYLQVDVNLREVVATFPHDRHMRAAVASCRGLRLLRQDPWECLASFILSSSKQIVQIRQIVAALSARFGTPATAPGNKPAFSFPTAAQLAAASEGELRACKMGFRAPYLRATARLVASGECDLVKLRGLSLVEAREQLRQLPGVGEKIADCVLLFAYGFPTAFPVDVWVAKALRKFYFRGRRVKASRLREFTETYFGPNAGYAQQYLFHHIRTKDAQH